MTTLAKLQHDFIHAFYQKEPNRFTRHLSTTPKITPSTQWQIYHGSITEGLAQHLRTVYATCETLVGADFFTGLIYTFIQQTPCYTDDLAQYGDTLADFIATFAPAAQLPYLADMSRLCWYRHCCQQQQQYQAFDIAQFACIEETQYDQLILQLQPVYYILSSPYPLAQIWSLCHTDNNEQVKPVDLNAGSVCLLIWWQHDHVAHACLTEQEYIVIQHLIAKPTLAELQLQLTDHAIDLQTVLPHFLQQGWLSGWTLDQG